MECKTEGKSNPIKVVQFGTGNFLRAFVDYMIDVANEKKLFNGDVIMVKQVPGPGAEKLESQGSKYCVVLQGKKNGEIINEIREIKSLKKCINPYENYDEFLELSHLDTVEFIVSNTTEAGIEFNESDSINSKPAHSYPGRLIQFLYERYLFFRGANDKGLTILPLELVNDNGGYLKKCVLMLAEHWSMDKDFIVWLESANTFCSTLVDRIVTGYSKDEVTRAKEKFGFDDKLLTVGEPFGLWVIEEKNDISKRLPLSEARMPILFTDNIEPYRERKVRILNGAHTGMALVGLLAGIETVGDAMRDADLRRFIDRIVYKEIVPMVPLDLDESTRFADSVMERFENPFLHHRLIDISLNSISKWRTRVLPTIIDSYKKHGKLPEGLVFALSALLAFDTVVECKDGKNYGRTDKGRMYEIRENSDMLKLVQVKDKADLNRVLSDSSLWGEDLTRYYPMIEAVWQNLNDIRRLGVREALRKL